MKIEIRNRCSDFNSYRAARVKSLFNPESVTLVTAAALGVGENSRVLVEWSSSGTECDS